MATKKKAAPQRAYSIQDLINEGIAYTPESTEATAAAEPEKRTWGQAIGDTAVQMAEGVNTTLGAVPSIVAPDGSMAGFFRDNAEYWRDKQSDVLKKRIAATDQRIQEAGKEGVMSQIGTAVSEYWDDPAQAARLVATNLPSMAATLGTGALAGAAAKGVAAARGVGAAGEAALAAQYGTRTAMATNAALNAGGARGEAYEDLKRAALAQGMSPEQAEQAALSGSILPGVVGGVAGAVSGKVGLEKALLGQAGTGVGTALRRSAGAFGAELTGEQIEEVAPKITTNYEAGKIDPTRSLTDDLGRTMVETTIGAGPGAIVAGGVEGMSTPAKEAADTIRNTEKLPESGALTKALNAGVEAKAQAVEAGAPVDGQIAPNPAPDPVDDPVRDQILALPDGARQDALRAYAVVNRTDVAKGVQQYNRKLLDRLLTENAPPPVLGERLTDTDMGSMLGGGGMAGRTDPLAGALGMNNEAQAAAITNVANVAERRPPMPASDAARMLDEARNRGLDLAVAEHPAGGFVLIPPNWVTPDMAAQGEARLNETIARMQQADAAPVDRAPRTRTDGVGLDLQTDPVQNYLDNLRSVNTPAARAYVRDFDAGRITPADVQQRMQAERGLTPEQRIARAAAEAPAPVDTVAERLRSAAAQGMATPAPTDILNPSGEPFKTKMAADRAAKKSPGAAVLPVVDGGFLVRPQEPVNVQDVPQAPEVPQAAPAISQPGQAPQAMGAQPAGPTAGVPAEGAGAVEAAGVSDQLEDALFKERDATTSAIENDWMNGNGRRSLTNIERAIYDATTASTLDADSAAQIIETALENDRPDLAQYAASRAMRAAESMYTTPGVPQSSPKYGKIKSDLEARKKQALDAASALQEIVNSKQAPQAVAGVGGATLYEQRKAKRGSSNQNQAKTPVEQAPDAATASRVAKEAQPFENRFVVKDDITGARVEWQALNPAGGWKVQTTFDNIEAATAAVASRGIDPAGVSVWDSAWNANAKRFTPAKKREADRQDAEMQASAATAAPQAEAAPAAATQQSQPQPSKEVRLTGIDKEYARLTQLRGTKVMLTHPDGRILYDVQLSVPWRRKNMIGTSPMQRFQFTENFEVKSKSDVTGNPGDEGFVLIDKRAQNAQRAAQNPTVAPASQAQQAAPVAQQAAPNSGVAAPAQETTYNGTRIYPTKVKVGDEVKSMWAAESPDNQRRRAAGERAIGGDSLHDTLEQAQAAAVREAKRDAAQQAAKAEQDAADKARLDAEEARKAANRPKTVVERRKDAILDGPSKIGQGTKRAVITSAVDNGYAIEAKMVYDYAAKKRDQEAVDRASRAGYILGVSNENLPLVKAGNEAKARLKEGKYEKPEYRVYQGSDTNAPFREITKTEYDYAQELKAQREAAPQAEAAPASATHQVADDFLPEGWIKIINGYTKRPVYRMEQGGGQPFAVVTQVEGVQYEVQIRHGDKQLIVSNQTGALSEVLAKAEAELIRMTQADSVTHQDPGEKAEAATPGVVTDSLKKAARNEDTKPSEMRKWLVAEIDKELLQAADRPDYDEAVKRMGEKDAISMFTGNGLLGKNSETGYITFDVPGDGKYKVRNSVRGLLEFRKNVMASPGFKDGGQKQNTNPPEQVDSARNGSGSTVEALRNFLADGDVQGAIEFAKLKGVEFTPVPPQMKMSADGNGKVKHMPASVKSSVPSVAEGLTQVEAEQINQYLTAESARKEPAATQDAVVQPSPQDFIPAPASASPESESSQGSSNARGQDASAPPTTPEVKADDVEPKIMSLPNDWPYANDGWVIVGGGRNAPGASSEKGAKIELSKNPEWKERGAVILPFRWNDGGLRGLSPYAETTTRYAILVRQKESPRIEASSETPTPPAAQPITRADVTAAQQQAAAIIGERIDAMTAGELNKIAKQFLPTMGKKATASKERNKAAMTDSAINLEAAAAEVGATLPADVRRVLQADMEDRVTGQDGPMFSRAPAAFSFAGQQAVTADQHALTTAQQRLDAGEDAEAVRQDTGWFKGTDGKWRFEINDADAKLLKEPSDPGVYADIFDEAASRSNGVPLGKVLDHPALFAAYPALKATRFIVDDKYSGNGSYSADENAIRVRDPYSYKNGPDQLLSVLLHEIQHGIQDIEGFASGGSPNEFRDESADAEMLRDGAILAVMMRSQGTIEKAKALFVQRFKREPAFGSESAALSGESPESMRARADNALAPHERYRRLAGEVEARNTQARQGMTDEQRRATPPSQTADVADSRVIVMFNGKEMANAPMPANAAPDAATTAQPLRTPAATIRAAITKAYGKLLGQLESKGLVTLTQTEDEAIEAAAQARAAKTGQSVEQARSTLRASVKNSVADQTQAENFQRWFKDSKAVDANGRPLVVYHGTHSSFTEFKPNDALGGGMFFSPSPEEAGAFTGATGSNIMPVYLSAQKVWPKIVRSYDEVKAIRAAKSKGYDAIRVRDDQNGVVNWVVFDPTQVKSATGNNGDFDPANPDIRRSADGSIQGFFDPQTGQSFLIADNLTAEAAPGVLMHEVGIHMAADGSMKALFNRAAMMLKLQRGSPFMKAVQDRMDAAGETSGEEAAAYIAEAYENDRANAPASVQRWLADLLAAVKAWMFKKGIMGADRLTVADIAAVARANARSMARDGGATGWQGFGPAFSVGEEVGAKALAEFAKADELFALPKSTKDTVEGIAADNDAQFTVSKPVSIGGRLEYTVTLPDGTKATLSVREPNPFGGEQVYDARYTDDGMELVPGRPGENPDDVPPTGDVWIDVSDLKKGDFGAKMYNIAATYAHNTGRIFIGDPHGLSKDALRRRLEQMISSALKFGTTAHLAPHPDQTRGGHGVPPLRWVYGDHVGNVERMIAASVKALDNGFPQSKLIEYRDGNFYNANNGKLLPRGRLATGLGESIAQRRSVPGAEGSTAQAGWRTVARAALFRHFQSSIRDAASGIPQRGSLLARGGKDVSRLERGEAGEGAFDANERIFYSRAGVNNTGGQAAESTQEPSSTTAAGVAARMGDAIKSVTVTNIKQRAGFKAADYLGLGLQALGRRQIVDIYGDMLPLAEYNTLVQQMEADKNEGGAEADQLVTRWAKLDDEAKLADLMHDATLAQIDPDKPYADGDDKGKFLMLERKFKLLSDDAKAVYRETRDAYKAHHAQVRSAIKERIERSELKGPRKAALLKQMDDEFFAAVKGVYFPLARFGQYAVTVKGPDGKVESVSRAETKAEAEALRNNLLSAFPRDKGFTVGRVMLSKDFIADRDAVGRGFMTELYQVLDKQDMDAVQRAELEDTLGQLYLSSLPDLSWAKHGIHRKGTPGFSQDARRAFAQNMFHGARYLAKLRYSDLMQDELAAMQKHVDDWREVEDFDQNSAQRVVDEMNKRHESLMNPKSNALSTALTSFGFIFHLGLSPASAMVNLSQTALVAYPIMGAKWGFGKASAALLKASAEAAKGKNDITGSLNEDERAAYDEAVRAGTIDVTMAHDLAGIAQGEDAGVMWKIRPVMRWASFMFHHAERFNRQVTFVAAYRLAREAGADQKAAFEQATKATYDGHFDYGAANRPRIMQGNVAKVLLLFKQYGQNMVYTLARNAQQSIKGESPEVRAQARKALGGLLATHAMAAGVLGLPMVTTLLAAASMIGGDDDEPWDAKVALQNLLADTFGQKPAEVLAHGLSRLTPWDISGRVGLDRLIFPDVQEGLEGQRLAESAMAAALGPVAGIGVNVLKGAQHMSEGRYALGLEAMLPSALRGPVKAIRYANEGVQDKSGISILDEVSPAAVAGQALGFSPSQARNAQEGKSAVMAHDRALGERRQELLTKAARASMAKDAEALDDARKEIARFNEKNPTRRITPLNVLQSVRNRQKRIDQAEGGVYLPKNRRDAVGAGRFAVVE